VFCHGRDTALVDSFVTEVAGNFFDSEHVETEMDRAVDAGPEVRLLTLGRWMITQQKTGEGIVDGLVVDKDMDWAFRRGDKVD